MKAAVLTAPGGPEVLQVRDVDLPWPGSDRDVLVRLRAARRYLDGEFDRQQAVDWLERYALLSPPRAERSVQFIEKYRSYVVNYNLGKDLVRLYVETSGGANPSVERRWQVFERLLASPMLPSDLSSGDRSEDFGKPEK